MLNRKVRVEIFYKTNDGEPISRPKHYPEEVELPGLTCASQVNDEVVCEAIMAHLKVSGARLLNISVFWVVLDSEVPDSYKVH